MHLPRKPSLPCLLAGTALLLCSCGGSSKGLIPSASAGPLRRDFEAVASAAKNGNGDCTATRRAIAKMERDYDELPRSIDVGLHERLSEGVKNLTATALSLCEQPQANTTATRTTEVVTSPSTTTSTSTSATETEEEEETAGTISSDTETLPSTSAPGGTVAPTENPPENEPDAGGTGAEVPGAPEAPTAHGGVGAP